MRARFILLGEKIEDRTQNTTNVAPSFRVVPSRQIEFTLNEQQAKREVDCEAAFFFARIRLCKFIVFVCSLRFQLRDPIMARWNF